MTPRDEGRLTMNRYDKPLTPRQIAATKDEDIDFSDIPELDETFWQQAELVEPEGSSASEPRAESQQCEEWRDHHPLRARGLR